MQEKDIRRLLEQVKNEDMSIEEAAAVLKELPYKDMGFANVDNHRAIRTGFPEVIFCQGKTPQQIRDIMAELVKKGGRIMGTRATAGDYEAVIEALPDAVFHKTAGSDRRSAPVSAKLLSFPVSFFAPFVLQERQSQEVKDLPAHRSATAPVSSP